ncbi:GntR family transcriptional regulator [Neobacillus sp. OS1-32]|jgi:GntR family transcriptional regulator|uniref:GntR family transcriptional regulator n=1 Tax=Neobacillus paridis TaxID=2803862 RepID=A0ABS1TNA8_9BACI|nr:MULTISPECIES: GntR family transcriptional regulator [Neobacillus]MBL4952791.1 GntR family transcriptional regulator [Neobacillus paridis]WML31684.1 GntR family transcriptional regulator [Neobacillus sp. OS1-32]
MKIDKNSHVPFYRQVEEVLEEKIISKQWDVGYQLPTEQELADLFDVSTITVKRAIIELVNKGYLYRQRGKGTFVAGGQNEQDIGTMFSLITDNEEHPHELISFSIEDSNKEIAEKLKLEAKAKIYKIKRLKINKDIPEALEYTYLPYKLCPGLTPEDIENELIYNVLLKKYHIALDKAKLFVRPYIVTGKKAERMQVEPGAPVFKWERFTYSKQGEIVEYSQFYDRQELTYYTEIKF